MAVTAATEGPEQLVERVQDLQSRLSAAGDEATRQLAEELVSAIVQMYGAGLEQVLGVLFAAGDEGARLAMTMADDPLVATLFMIHDLHPVPLADRVDLALEHVRPYMESHGGNVELLSLEDGVARLRLEGSCSDCSASAVTLELAIKQALEQAAPDLDGLEVEGVLETESDGEMHRPIPPARRRRGSTSSSWTCCPPASWWSPRSAAPSWSWRTSRARCWPTGTAARGCGGALHAGALVEGALHCPHCSRSFFLPRGGRSMDEDRLQLEPVPLLREHGTVKVALAT